MRFRLDNASKIPINREKCVRTCKVSYVSCVVTHRKKHARDTKKEDTEKEMTLHRKAKVVFRHEKSVKEALETVFRWRIREPVRSY